MIEIQEVQPRHTVTIRAETTPAGIGPTCADVLGAVFGYIQKKGAQPASPPFALYHSYSPERVDMEGGMVVAEPLAGEGRIQSGQLPGGRAAVLWHMGPYDDLARTHGLLQQFCKDKGTPSRLCWEVYWTDPGSEPDPQKWKTEVVYLLEK